MRGHGAVGRTLPRPGPAADHRLDRPRRLGVGGHAVRRAPRRPEGLRLRDALRRGLGPLRRVRAVLHRAGRADLDEVLARVGPREPPPASLDGLERASCVRLGRVVVAFSGGADSAFLAKVAHDTLGPARVLVRHRHLAVAGAGRGGRLPGRSPSEWGLRWRGRPDRRDGRPALRRQRRRPLRPLQDRAHGGARRRSPRPSAATVVLGVNVDDLGDHRPGQAAAAAARRPVPAGRRRVHQGATSGDWSRRLGLRTWDKPAAACLSSRIPYGTPVTLGALGSIARAEAALRELGFGQLRVRHHGTVARIEVDPEALAEVVDAPRRGRRRRRRRPATST